MLFNGFLFVGILHLHIQLTRFHDGFGFLAVGGPVDVNAESHPAIFGEVGKRHFIGYRRSLVFGSNGLHYRSLFWIGIATVVFVGQPAAVRIGLDVEPAAGKSESQRRITTLLYQPAVFLSCLINRISLFIFHRISLLIQLRHLFIPGILLEDSSLIQLYEIASENNGTWTGTGQNPIEWMANNPVSYKKYKVLSTVFADITPIQNLTVRIQFGADYSHATTFMQSFPSYVINNEQGTAGRNSSDVLKLSETATANYRWALNDDHSFNFMLGQEAMDYQSSGFQVVTKGQSSDFLTNISSGTRASSWDDTTSAYSYLSFFLRGEYNYKDLYYGEMALRTDASSRFGKDHRWGMFWSLGFMWNIKNESFLKDIEWLTSAQIALSTGTSGNSEIPYYDHLALVSGGPKYNDEAGIYPKQSGNEELSWEQTWSNNIGLRLGFFNRVNLDIDFYHKKTTDMLMSVPESYAITGEGYRWDNIGAMVNRGVEVSVNGDIIRTKDFTWNLNANVSYNKNKLVELYNGVQEYVNSTTGLKFVVGHPVHEYFLNRYAGVNPANGDALWYTKDGELTTEFNESDKVMTGNTFDSPWAGGFGTTFAWKGLSLSAQFSWMADRWVMNNDRFFEESNGLYSTYNQSRRLLYDRWKKPGDITDIPRYGVTAQLDDRFLENSSFLRLKNLTLAYALPQPLLKKTNFFTSARVYLQGQNLLTFTGFTGLDPEMSSNIYRAQYPASRQFTLGIEVSF